MAIALEERQQAFSTIFEKMDIKGGKTLARPPKPVSELLAEARENMLKHKLSKAELIFDRVTWNRIKQPIEDYFNGMTVAEVCKKHKMIGRTDFYHYLKQAGIDQMPHTALMAFLDSYRVKGNKVFLPKQISECPCRSCSWLTARVNLINGNLIE
jgi:hypothetical protein